jgi:hypothetical protein
LFYEGGGGDGGKLKSVGAHWKSVQAQGTSSFNLFYFVLFCFKFLLFPFQDNPNMSSDFLEERYAELEFNCAKMHGAQA